MRTMPITILNNKDEIKEFLTKNGAKEHFKHKGFYGTPDNKVLAIKKNQYNKYSVYEVQDDQHIPSVDHEYLQLFVISMILSYIFMLAVFIAKFNFTILFIPQLITN